MMIPALIILLAFSPLIVTLIRTAFDDEAWMDAFSWHLFLTVPVGAVALVGWFGWQVYQYFT